MTTGPRTGPAGVSALASIIPRMHPGETKRNVAVGLSYLLVLWVVGARVLLYL